MDISLVHYIYIYFCIDWRDVIATSLKYKDAIKELGLGKLLVIVVLSMTIVRNQFHT